MLQYRISYLMLLLLRNTIRAIMQANAPMVGYLVSQSYFFRMRFANGKVQGNVRCPKEEILSSGCKEGQLRTRGWRARRDRPTTIEGIQYSLQCCKTAELSALNCFSLVKWKKHSQPLLQHNRSFVNCYNASTTVLWVWECPDSYPVAPIIFSDEACQFHNIVWSTPFRSPVTMPE